MASEGDQKFFNYWKGKHNLGKWKYSFYHGLMMFAWPCFLLSELFKYWTRNADYDFSLNKFIVGFLIWTLLGFLTWGLWMWRSNEKNFERIKRENPEL